MPSSKGVSAGPMMTAFLEKISKREKGKGKDVPGHDIVGDGRGGYTSWGVGLHSLEEMVC